MYKLSVIIPVYNAENTLIRAIDSVLNQKWDGNISEDIEIILVDDCSTDNSNKIMAQYSKKYNNIKCFTTEKNTGYPSAGRNIGIKVSNSSYIMFMDNDDEYCEDMCQTLFDVISKKHADVVTCNWYNIVDEKVNKMNLELNSVETDDKYITFNSFDPIFINEWWPWKYIYKKSLLIDNNIFFPEKVCEDVFFLGNVLLNMEKIIYIKDFYGYKRHFKSDSLSSVSNPDITLEYLNTFFEVEDFLASCFDFDIYEEYKFSFARIQIQGYIFRILFLQKTSDMNVCLDKLHEYESYIQFDNSLPDILILNKIVKFINFFILTNHRTVTILLMKLFKIPFRLRSFIYSLKSIF